MTDPTEVSAGPNRRRGPLVGIAAAAVILIAGLVLFLTRDNTPVAEPAPNATELTDEFQPLAPGAYYADTDGNEETATRGTFVIEGDGWTDRVFIRCAKGGWWRRSLCCAFGRRGRPGVVIGM